MSYLPIEDYGVIGNMRTVALIGRNGSLDWLCFPDFDSPSVFAAILDDSKGGWFRISPMEDGEEVTHKQIYWPDTNVLMTRFLSEDGVAEVTDYMPIGQKRAQGGFHGIIRKVLVVRGEVKLRMECRPAFNYGRDKHSVELVPGGAKFRSSGLHLGFATDQRLRQEEDAVVAEFVLKEGCAASFELHALERDDAPIGLTAEQAEELFRRTVNYWRSWLSKCTYKGRWRETVYRSALLLKLLTFEPTGAIVAAPTASLPEHIGGSRNWDYRYTWIRDASFTLYSFMRIGFTEEAAAFMEWLDQRCHELKPDGALQIMYGIRGEHDLREEELSHLDGYKGSKPVRIGNGAVDQLQLDIYGELMDSVYLYNKHVMPISWDLWQYIRRLTNWVCEHWEEKDEAIWEVRGGRKDFTYSKVMCWVALDRAVKIAQQRSLPADWRRWYEIRDQIYLRIMEQGWSEKRQAFVQYFGSDALDASVLMMPLVFFVSQRDPRMLSTLEAIMKHRSEGGLMSDGLVYRYDASQSPDGLQGVEGTFNLCTFWLVDALTRAGAREPEKLYEARQIFEKMLGYANHVGLFSEQIGGRGEALGNYPQALTHLALISAAVNLDQALGGGPSDGQE